MTSFKVLSTVVGWTGSEAKEKDMTILVEKENYDQLLMRKSFETCNKRSEIDCRSVLICCRFRLERRTWELMGDENWK